MPGKITTGDRLNQKMEKPIEISHKTKKFDTNHCINISELIIDETIHVETTPNMKKGLHKEELKHGKRGVLFQPDEIDSSWTVCNKIRNNLSVNPRPHCNTASSKDVQQLLSTSLISKDTKKLNNCNGGLFSYSSLSLNNDSAFCNEEFAPGELMESKFLKDEISWAKNYASIPVGTACKNSKEKAVSMPDISLAASSDPNFSIGSYFNERSDNILGIVDSKCKEKSLTSNKIKVSKAKDVNTPLSRECKLGTCNSNKSYLLNISAIDHASHGINRNTDVTEDNLINKLKTKAKKKCPKQMVKPHQKDNELFEFDVEKTLQPDAIRSGKKPNISSSYSPIGVKLFAPSYSDIDADDEWPSKPIKSPDRLMRRTKSPSMLYKHKKSPQAISPSNKAPTSIKSPVNVCRARLPSPEYEQPHASPKNHPIKISQKRPSPIHRRESPNLRDQNKLLISEPQRNTNLIATTPTKLNTAVDKSPNQTKFYTGKIVSSTSDCFRTPKMDSINNSSARLMGLIGCSYSIPNSLPNPKSQIKLSSPRTQHDTNEQQNLVTKTLITLKPAVDKSPNHIKIVPPKSVDLIVGACSSPITNNTGQASSTSISRCSNLSEFSHHEGQILPLKVTDKELCWGSTKLRANSRKTLQVKNISDKRLVLRISIAGPGFSLLNLQSSTLAFQSQECRTITVNFSPTVTGAAIGILSFYSSLNATSSNNLPYMELPLYGYGGNAIFQLQNIAKGPIGSAFLTMGEHLVELANPLIRTIKVHNRGPLLGFALVTIDSNGLHGPRLCDAFEVKPTQMLIQSGEAKTVTIIFRPKREEIKQIARKKQSVYTLANMRVIVGDEANRQRIRRLVQRMSDEERLKLTYNSLEFLWSCFPGEYPLSELNGFERESIAVASDLIMSVTMHEIALTINHHESLDNTVESTASTFCFFPGDNDSLLFRTVYAANVSPTSISAHRSGAAEPKIYSVNELHEVTVSSTTTLQNHDDRHDEGGWSVAPNEITFDFPREVYASLLVRNTFRSRQYFKVTCRNMNLLRFIPSEGYIQPDGGQVEIEVHALQSCPPTNLQSNNGIFIEVSMENECIRVPVKFTNNFNT